MSAPTRILAIATILIAGSSATAQVTEPAPVFTRARLTSTFEEGDGKFYVRLKLLPSANIPFTTQAFRLNDRALIASIPQGSWVRFTAKHVAGENTLTSIHIAEECMRFRPCN